LGLQDSYVHDGRVLIENLEGDAVPHRLREDSHTLRNLVGVFKQINAPFGEFGVNSLKVSTAALASNSPNDATYSSLESKIGGWVARRDAIATGIRALLDGAAFREQHLDEHRAKQLIEQARSLLTEVSRCAADTVRCTQ